MISNELSTIQFKDAAPAQGAPGRIGEVLMALVQSAFDNPVNALLQAACTGARIEEAWLYVTNATGEQTDYEECLACQ